MVSVIVPVYKSEKTLKRCVESLTMQSYENIEILLIVDGPPDKSGELAEELAKKDLRIRVIHQKNQGVSSARNRGIEEAKGEYIRFLDSDDYADKSSIEWMMMEMEQHPEADMVIAGYNHLFFGRSILKLPPKEGLFIIKNNEELIFSLYMLGFLNMPWNKLYRKELIKNGFPKDMNLGEDLIFNLSYMENCKEIAVIQKPVCEYIQDDRGTTLSTKLRKDKLEIALLLYERTREAFERLFGHNIAAGNLENKLLIEFLDDMEELAFIEEHSRNEKLMVIQNYYKTWRDLVSDKDKFIVNLPLLDYKIIYFFFKRGMFSMTYFMILLRSFAVKLLKRR